MKELFKLKKIKVHPAMVAAWAALMAVAGLLPSFPVFGSGGNFSVSYALAPLAGIMFGPFTGALSVAIGEFIGSIIAPHNATLGIFTFIINTANAFVAGYIARKKWGVGVLYIGILTALWFILPPCRNTGMYFVVYLAGMLMCPVGGIFGTRLLEKDNYFLRMVGLFLIAWPAYIAGSITGNIPTCYIFQIPAELWSTFLVWVTPFERTIFAIAAAVIGTPLLAMLPKIGVYVGPKYDGEEQDSELDAKVKATIDSKR